jgi:DNA-binding transcriptional ArsR family regulator
VEYALDNLSQTFSALADPTRRAILQQLTQGGASFTDLARPHQISRPAVVKHIKALEKSGLVERTGSATRPVYQLSAAALREPVDWLSNYQQFWDSSLDRLDDYVREVTEQKGGKA